MKNILDETIVIMGPTASGKSDLAIVLAKKYNGEIVSADSRQIYRGMNIGTGKVTKAEQKLAKHWLLDVASPKRNYNVTHFVRDAKKVITNIKKRGNLPIICGGTGFWIQSLIEDNGFPAVKPHRELRRKLSTFSAEELFRKLQKADPARAKTIDPKNKIRLIRALEIVEALGKVPPLAKNRESKNGNQKIFILALSPEKDILRKNIEVRLEKRLKQGLIAEVKKLRSSGLSWKRLEGFGLEYKYIALLLQNKMDANEMKKRLTLEIHHYAKRQLTWLRRYEKMGASISWITDPQEAEPLLKKMYPTLSIVKS